MSHLVSVGGAPELSRYTGKGIADEDKNIVQSFDNLLVTFSGMSKKEQISVDIDKPQPSTFRPPDTLKRKKIHPLYSPLPQTPEIKVAFNQDRSSIYTDPYRNITRYGTNLELLIVQEINQAKESVDIAVQALSLPIIAHALVKQQKQSVKVRVIMENSYAKPWIRISPRQAKKLTPEQQSIWAEYFSVVDANNDNILSTLEIKSRDVLTIFKDNKIVWKDDTSDRSKGSGLMHHKFIVIDKHRVITGSPNLTLSSLHGDKGYQDSRGNAEHLVVVESEQLAKLYTEEFNIMWNGKFGVKKPKRKVKTIKMNEIEIKVNFSPDSRSVSYDRTSNGLITETIAKSKRRIDFALFVFSDQEIANQLNLQHKKNVSIGGIVDPNFAYVNYSKTLDMWGLVTGDKNCKSKQIPWQSPLTRVGVPQIAPSDKMHHKFAVIDNSIVITGSHNWSEAANNTNDENLLIIKSPIIAAHFDREMERLSEKAQFGASQGLLVRAQNVKKNCQKLEFTSNNLPINLNTATLEELDILPGIGKVTAMEIIKARPIRSWDDLEKVKGISQSKVKRIKSNAVL